jgi:hypothetical protein
MEKMSTFISELIAAWKERRLGKKATLRRREPAWTLGG